MWTLVGAHIARFWIAWLRSVHLPVGTRDGHALDPHGKHVRKDNKQQSRVIYLASGYKERVREVFESRVTRLNAWKGARVQGMHVRVRWAHGRTSGTRVGAWTRGKAHGRARGHVGVRGLAHGWHCSPESDDTSPEMH
ncbi:hypothetical protein CRG98_013744 [Punica granatum]|uniref:Secreted protein n=1 Tax=Punica granatum TaxID=22663 RepID=A0A2I0KCP2_PUNGR|nr:hypothetical protein CRG98_013744 [Punica granatum]